MASFKERLLQKGDSLLDERGTAVYQMMKIAETEFVQRKKTKVLEIKNQIRQHGDLAVKSRDSLVLEQVNAAEWVAKRHALALALRVTLIELKQAMAIDAEEFPKSDEDDDLLDSILGEDYN